MQFRQCSVKSYANAWLPGELCKRMAAGKAHAKLHDAWRALFRQFRQSENKSVLRGHDGACVMRGDWRLWAVWAVWAMRF
jgi:hypothetical protein